MTDEAGEETTDAVSPPIVARDCTLQRDDVTTARSFGTLTFVGDSSPTFDTLEPGANNNAPGRSSIPARAYRYRLRFSPIHGIALFGALNVPGRNDVEIHSLNWVVNPETEKRETEGCQGVGHDRAVLEGEDAIEHSRQALDEFMAAQGVPNYRELTTAASVFAFIDAHPSAAEFTLTICDPLTQAAA